MLLLEPRTSSATLTSRAFEPSCGQLCLRWRVELSYGAGSAWKMRAFAYLALQLSQVITLSMTLLHFAQVDCARQGAEPGSRPARFERPGGAPSPARPSPL